MTISVLRGCRMKLKALIKRKRIMKLSVSENLANFQWLAKQELATEHA
jgi:hypothetical protein